MSDVIEVETKLHGVTEWVDATVLAKSQRAITAQHVGGAIGLYSQQFARTRGFFVVALFSPQKPVNVGAVLRAAACYGAAQVNIGCRESSWLHHAANTPKADRHLPVYLGEDPLEPRPHGTEVVAVDLVPGAVPLPRFIHPHRAIYVFGPENGTLGKAILDRAQHRVMVPTATCMNLAACVNVVLYDRMAKSHRGSA